MDNQARHHASTVKAALARSRENIRTRTIQRLRDTVRETLEQPPRLAATVYLFGSWATGTFDGYSDTDLLVLAPDQATATEAQTRLLRIGDDVLALCDADWQSRIASGAPFWSRLSEERLPLVDTRDGERQ